MLLSQVLLVFSCGLLDKLRGDDSFLGKPATSWIYGVFVATIAGSSYLQAAIFGILWAVGASFSWGEPVGAMLDDRRTKPANLEWWQFGLLKERPVVACLFRGGMWGVCTLPMMYFDLNSLIISLSMVGVFPVAIFLAKQVQLGSADRWTTQEYFRGWLVGFVALSASFI